MENSSRPQQNKEDLRKESLIAWRLSPHLVPMFKDLAQQAYEAHLIKQPKLTSLAKFSLSFFAEMWLQQKAAQARYDQEHTAGSIGEDIGFCTLYETTVHDDNVPENLLKFYDRFSQADEESLTKSGGIKAAISKLDQSTQGKKEAHGGISEAEAVLVDEANKVIIIRRYKRSRRTIDRSSSRTR